MKYEAQYFAMVNGRRLDAYMSHYVIYVMAV